MQEVEACAPGRRASLSHDVTSDDTAITWKTGDVPVLATPRVLALAEEVAVESLAGCLDQDNTTVGSWVELHHLAPTTVGNTVEVEAVLIGVHGRRLEFSIHVFSGETEVARIKHRRVVVQRSKFAA